VPALNAREYAARKADIDERGLWVPFEVTAEGVVLDGHRRLPATRELGIDEVDVQVVAPLDELEHILRAALLRRQLSASQRAALALKLPYLALRARAAQRQQANLRRGAEVANVGRLGRAHPRPDDRTRQYRRPHGPVHNSVALDGRRAPAGTTDGTEKCARTDPTALERRQEVAVRCLG
jgi:hypothetical protein